MKIAAILTVFSLLFLTNLSASDKLLSHFSAKKISLGNDPKYMLFVKKMFPEESYPKAQKILKDIGAPFYILSVDYKNNTMTIQITEKTSWDNVKNCIDKLRLTIVKDTLVN